MLLDIYKERLKGINICTSLGLEELYRTDEKTFYFYLMYCFLANLNIEYDLRTNVLLSNAITLFCISADNKSISEYYSKYIDLKETPDQIKKIMAELKQEEFKALNIWQVND